MLTLGKTVVIAALAAGAVASPVADPMAAVKRADSCTFTGSDGAAKAKDAQKSCSTIILKDVSVPAGETLNLGSLEDDTTVIFEGKTTWGYKEWKGPLLRIQGTGITVKGGDGHVLDGEGSRWWDGEGTNGGKDKPKFFYAHKLFDSSIEGLNIKNTPVQAVSIHGSEGLTVTDMTIDTSDGDSNGGHNTDAFDIGESKHITITGAKVYNQDDCVAVNSGSDITFSGGLCSGGHGLSIGSVGGRDDNVVENVTFEHSEIRDSDNGCRVKARKNEDGKISGVKFSDITLNSIHKYGILIEQNYDGGDLHGNPTSDLPITDLTLENIKGKGAVDSDGHNIAIVCGSSGCSDWTWDNVEVTGGDVYEKCKNVPSVASC